MESANRQSGKLLIYVCLFCGHNISLPEIYGEDFAQCSNFKDASMCDNLEMIIHIFLILAKTTTAKFEVFI